MEKNCFVKQNHKNIKIPLIMMFLCLLIITITFNIKTQQLYFESLLFLSIIFLLFICFIRLYDSFGIYVLNKKIYYKKFIKKQIIDIKSIVGIKIIKAEAQTNIAWSSFALKDKKSNELYTAVYLSNVEKNMTNYPYGDIEFIRQYRNDVIMYSIYNETLIKYLKKLNKNIEVF